VIALVEDSEDALVLFRGVPTEGTEVGHSPYGSPLRGPTQLHAVKVAAMDSGVFQTIVPHVDPRDPIAFGRAAR
jgi:hypothetical protein